MPGGSHKSNPRVNKNIHGRGGKGRGGSNKIPSPVPVITPAVPSSHDRVIYQPPDKIIEHPSAPVIYHRPVPLIDNEAHVIVADLVKRVQKVVTELTVLQNKIHEAYPIYIEPSYKNKTTLMEQDYNSKAAMYDRMFQEKEGQLQASGGRSRQQTLQEYILTFFFVSFGILAISLSLLSTTLTGVVGKGMQVFGLMFLISILSGALIIRYG